eukprot:6979239-Alexandrium_andersonii.AAC.1
MLARAGGRGPRALRAADGPADGARGGAASAGRRPQAAPGWRETRETGRRARDARGVERADGPHHGVG